jgi:NAD(P) transhydrogenase
MPRHYQVVVIGSGPAGKAVAMRASKAGMVIAMVDEKSMAESVIARQVKRCTTSYARNRVKLYHGQTRFTDSNTLEVVKGDGSIETLMADKFVIATGSRPYRPDYVDFTNHRVYDSDTILKWQHTLSKIVIYGAGLNGLCRVSSL